MIYRSFFLKKSLIILSDSSKLVKMVVFVACAKKCRKNEVIYILRLHHYLMIFLSRNEKITGLNIKNIFVIEKPHFLFLLLIFGHFRNVLNKVQTLFLK